MTKFFTLAILICSFSVTAIGQVSINDDNSTPNPGAMLDVKSTTKGFLPPRMTTIQRDQIVSPPVGLQIFNTDCEEYQYYKTTGWKTLGSGSGQIASPGVINGNTSLCAQVTAVGYSAAAVPDATSYSWTVPAGATIVSGQGTNAIVVNYGASGGSVCVTAINACYSSVPTCISVSVSPAMTASISITTGTTSICQGTMTTFTSTTVNGGSSPLYQWKKNNLDISGATNATYSYVPDNNDIISCRMISNGSCVTSPSVYSNYITMTVFSTFPGAPTEGTHVSGVNAITWEWNAVTNVSGYKWNTTNDYATATDMGSAKFKAESGLSCNTSYTRYVWAYNGCGSSTSTPLSAPTYFGPVASVTITTSANPVCSGAPVTFTAAPVNGGPAPLYQWRKNGTNVTGATNATYTCIPASGDSLRCQMTSVVTCAQNNPVWSNMETLTVNPLLPVSVNITASASQVAPGTPVTFTATPVNGGTSPQYQWRVNGGNVNGATSVNYTYTPLNADQVTCLMSSSEVCISGSPATSNQITMTVTTCGTSVLTINHVTTGGVAPVNKTTSYSSVTNIPGEPAKCWITKNLGATQQATAVNDATEASAGWYWQFNRKQGYKHDGSTLTPGWTIALINENSDWLISSDPCNLELGAPWRIPTYTEWYNVDITGSWINWNGAWSSVLKLHAAGYLYFGDGSLSLRGTGGVYWTSKQHDASLGWHLYIDSSSSYLYNNNKAYCFSVRCLRD